MNSNKELLDLNEIIKIEQLPKIYQQLDKINEMLLEKTGELNEALKNFYNLSSDEQEERKKDIKNYKTYLNSILNQMEDKRKDIKKQILKPYDDFNTYYDEKIKKLLDKDIYELNEIIKKIEKRQLDDKKKELNDFLNEYIEYYHIEAILTTIDQLPIKINLSNSISSLKGEIIRLCEKVSNDLVCISSDEDRDEILLEYKNNGFDYSSAKANIVNKKKQLKTLNNKLEQYKDKIEEEQKVVENVNTLCSSPIEIEEETIEVEFKVKTIKSKIIELKKFMKEKGIDYE